MEEDSVVALPRPGASITDDPLLAVLREGARRMLMQAIEAEVVRHAGREHPAMLQAERPSTKTHDPVTPRRCPI